MSGPDELTAQVVDHARRVVTRDVRAREDLAPDAEIEPADLLDRLLLREEFRGFELVAHARIGAHHIFKIKYVGPVSMVIQTRWVQGPAGRWQIHESEIARVAVERRA